MKTIQFRVTDEEYIGLKRLTKVSGISWKGLMQRGAYAVEMDRQGESTEHLIYALKDAIKRGVLTV